MHNQSQILYKPKYIFQSNICRSIKQIYWALELTPFMREKKTDNPNKTPSFLVFLSNRLGLKKKRHRGVALQSASRNLWRQSRLWTGDEVPL